MATRSATTARNEVLDMLRSDHKKVKQAFREFASLDMEDDADLAMELVTRTCNELMVHATVEEELFYPAVREAIKDPGILAEAKVEHDGAKDLMAKLSSLEPDDEEFAASFKVLGEYVKHHIKEEEGEMFDQLERARVNWDELKSAMEARQAELMAEMGLTEPSDESDADEDSSSDARAARKQAAPRRGGQSAAKSVKKSARAA